MTPVEPQHSESSIIIENSTEIRSIKERQDRSDRDINRRLGILEKGITDIRDNLLGRPTWVQLIIITLLSGLCAGLSTWALTVLKLVIEVT